MKILNESHMSDKIMVNHLEKIANKIFEENKITFLDDELPNEGTDQVQPYTTIEWQEWPMQLLPEKVVSYPQGDRICSELDSYLI